MADGSTDRSVAEQESVFVRYVVGGEPVSKFIASQEVKDARAAGVLDAIDTASVNMGIYNGVAARVRNRNGQHVTVTHCINHGLKLSVLDTRKEDEYLVKFDNTIKGVFSFYSKSQKRVKELDEVAKLLDANLSHFGGLQQICWVVSQRRALYF